MKEVGLLLVDEYILLALFFAICIVLFRKYLRPAPHSFSADPGTYVIGKNIPPGKYDLVAHAGTGDFCILECNAIDWHPPHKLGVEGDDCSRCFRNITLKKGDTLEINGSLHIKTRTPAAIKNVSLEPLDPGNYKIGSDILPGTYNLEVLSGKGQVYTTVTGQEGNPFFQEMAKDDKKLAKTFENLELTEETQLFIRGNLSLKLTPAPNTRRWRWMS